MIARQVAAVVLAAGYSQRMGFFKPLRKIRGRSPLQRIFSSLTEAGIREIIVVTGHRRKETEEAVSHLGGKTVFNLRFSQGMFTSVQAGIAALSSHARAFFLLPADIPLVRPSTLRLLLKRGAFDRIIYPVFLAERGHPPLIGTSFIPSILSYGGDGGLRKILESRNEWAEDLSVADEGVLLDMDTPADYERIVRHSRKLSIPSRRECRALFDLAGTPERVMAHSEKVAAVALGLAFTLPKTHRPIIELLQKAALLHDLCRTEPEHSRTGSALFFTSGFPRVAKTMEGHKDLPPFASTEASLLYLADKLVQNTSLIPLEKRKKIMLDRYSGDLPAQTAIRRRYARAMRIQ
ncbi:MAG: NTP transferase domain-containing protein, partial [Synergistaceae bacterium]|nr:NTP transferase domain-containing protein [Synergistaceae bacterium]